MDDTADPFLDVASRIKQFSIFSQHVDNNNMNLKKPNPYPRRRSKIDEQCSVNETAETNEPRDKPSPVPRNKGNNITLSETKPKTKPRPVSSSTDSTKTNNRAHILQPMPTNNIQKPKLPLRPSLKPKPLCLKPASNFSNLMPEKPPRGNNKICYPDQNYENADLFENKIIRNQDSGHTRCDTLDGLIIGNSTKTRENYTNNHITVIERQSSPASFLHQIQPSILKQSSHRNSKSESGDRSSSDEDYDFPYEPDNDVIYDEADMGVAQAGEEIYDNPMLPRTFDPARKHSFQRQVSSGSDDSNYEKPADDWTPTERRQSNLVRRKHSTCSDEDYDLPDVDPEVFSTRKGENNLQSSSSDDDDIMPDYTDPEDWLSKPPVALDIRRGSHFSPEQYMPASEGVMVNNDDFAKDMYMDPNYAFSIPPVSLNFNEDSNKDMYSDEPLYQEYTAEMLQECRQSNKTDESKDNDTRSSVRVLWSQLPEVKKNGFLDMITPTERKRQEAMYEVIASEASYLKSLDVLVSQFMMSPDFLPNPSMPSSNPNDIQIINRQQYHFLFSGVSTVKAVSERFLKDLRRRQQDSVLLDSISDIILDYAENHFNCYIKYCSNQVFQDRTLQALLHSSPQFTESLTLLQADSKCHGLTMHSFLTLPMQRITRMPLLLDAILSHCEAQSEEYISTDRALKSINVVVHESNEGARKMERTEEMCYIQKTLTFKIKPIPLISSSRWLVKKGMVSCLHEEGRFSKYKNQIRQIFKGKCKSIHLFLFTDLLLVTKMKSEENFKVIDYCQRSLLRVEELTNIPDPEPPKVVTLYMSPIKYAFTLVLLENANNKTVDYHCFLETETAKTRWLESFHPKQTQLSNFDGESVYDDFDCPQMQTIHSYQAQQSDELSLIEGDTLEVLRKLPDGWAEGMRLRDGARGWFPLNHAEEIDSKHMRAKNLLQRYRMQSTLDNHDNEKKH